MGAMRTCETCRSRVGLTCHFNPPGVLPNQTRIWPTIELTDWCFQRRPLRELEMQEYREDDAAEGWVDASEPSTVKRRWWRFGL